MMSELRVFSADSLAATEGAKRRVEGSIPSWTRSALQLLCFFCACGLGFVAHEEAGFCR